MLVVVHDRAGMILLLKRADVDDFWQSVTGSLRWGESAERAARRELFEETGIAEAEGLVDWKRKARFQILSQFTARYAPGTENNVEYMFSLETRMEHPIVLDPLEHVEYQWRPYADALDIVWSWSNRDAIEALAQNCWR